MNYIRKIKLLQIILLMAMLFDMSLSFPLDDILDDEYMDDDDYDDDDISDYREIVFEVMHEPDHLTAALRCVLGSGYCSQTGRLIKHLLSEALYDECADCSEDKNEAVKDLILQLMQQSPQDWMMIADMYDVTGNVAKQYEDMFDFHYPSYTYK